MPAILIGDKHVYRSWSRSVSVGWSRSYSWATSGSTSISRSCSKIYRCSEQWTHKKYLKKIEYSIMNG